MQDLLVSYEVYFLVKFDFWDTGNYMLI